MQPTIAAAGSAAVIMKHGHNGTVVLRADDRHAVQALKSSAQLAPQPCVSNAVAAQTESHATAADRRFHVRVLQHAVDDPPCNATLVRSDLSVLGKLRLNHWIDLHHLKIIDMRGLRQKWSQQEMPGLDCAP